MIARLRGVLIEKGLPWIVLDVQGVGYSLEVPLSTYDALSAIGEEVVIHTEMVVREDAMLLYGFVTTDEKSLFRLLIKLNGVGPKIALAILSAMSVQQFVQAVRDKQIVHLVKIPGVGKKTAERLLLELETPIQQFDLSWQPLSALVSEAPSMPNSSLLQQQAIQALEGLGYKSVEAVKRVEQGWQAGLTLSELIKRSLQVSS